MICPFCQKEMEKGYIYTGKDPIVWTPEKIEPSALIHHQKQGEVVLLKRNLLKRMRMIVYRCPHCQIDIIDEKQSEE